MNETQDKVNGIPATIAPARNSWQARERQDQCNYAIWQDPDDEGYDPEFERQNRWEARRGYR